jgi:hypothetical protein
MLTESQKNYIALFLLRGETSENELRMFLAKSGWDIGGIDAAVKYSSDDVLKKTVTEVSLGEITAVTPALQSISTNIDKSSNFINNESMASVIPSSTNADLYKEIPVISVPNEPLKMTIENTMEVTPKEQEAVKNSLSNIDDLSMYHHTENVQSGVTLPVTRNTMSDIVPVSVMPQATIKEIHTGSRVLTVIIWILVLLLIASIAAVLGYMYYTGTGIFSNLTYIKLQ